MHRYWLKVTLSKREKEEGGEKIGGPYTHIIPQTQIGAYQIILNTLEIELKVVRIDSTTNERKEATLKKVGGVET